MDSVNYGTFFELLVEALKAFSLLMINLIRILLEFDSKFIKAESQKKKKSFCLSR